MKHLDINFASCSDRPAWLGWCVLVGGALATVSVILAHMHVDAEYGELAYKVERLKHALARTEGDVQQASVEPTKQMPEFSWLEMLDGLGLQLGESVTLLSLQGDLQIDQLELQCEAKDADTMFSFLARLEESALFFDIALRSHETVRDSPFKPVRFTLTAYRSVQP